MKKALLIGINYPGRTDLQLNGCVNDVNNIEQVLLKKCNYPQANIVKLIDQNASTSMIRSSIVNFVTNCKAGDILFFYYSGHGAQITGSITNEKNEDNTLIPNDYEKSGLITDNWLYDNLAMKVPKDVMLWAFTDCCHSGTMFDLKYNWNYTPVMNKGSTEKVITDYKDSNWANNYNVSIIDTTKETIGRVVLFSGCTDNQTSADSFENNQPQGAFSYCLNQFLQLNPNFNTRSIAYMLKEINCHLFIKGYSQRSQLSVGKQTDFNINFNP
jgi:hypothetical protein